MFTFCNILWHKISRELPLLMFAYICLLSRMVTIFFFLICKNKKYPPLASERRAIFSLEVSWSWDPLRHVCSCVFPWYLCEVPLYGHIWKTPSQQKLLARFKRIFQVWVFSFQVLPSSRVQERQEIFYNITCPEVDILLNALNIKSHLSFRKSQLTGYHYFGIQQ